MLLFIHFIFLSICFLSFSFSLDFHSFLFCFMLWYLIFYLNFKINRSVLGSDISNFQFLYWHFIFKNDMYSKIFLGCPFVFQFLQVSPPPPAFHQFFFFSYCQLFQINIWSSFSNLKWSIILFLFFFLFIFSISIHMDLQSSSEILKGRYRNFCLCGSVEYKLEGISFCWRMGWKWKKVM